MLYALPLPLSSRSFWRPTWHTRQLAVFPCFLHHGPRLTLIQPNTAALRESFDLNGEQSPRPKANLTAPSAYSHRASTTLWALCLVHDYWLQRNWIMGRLSFWAVLEASVARSEQPCLHMTNCGWEMTDRSPFYLITGGAAVNEAANHLIQSVACEALANYGVSVKAVPACGRQPLPSPGQPLGCRPDPSRPCACKCS